MREVFFNSFKEKILNGQVPNMFDVHGTPVTSDFIDIFDNDEIKLEQYKTLDDFNKYANGNDTKTLEQTTFRYEEYGVEYSAYYNNDVSEKPIFVNPDNWEKFLQTYSGEIGYSDPMVKTKFDQYIYQSDENINSGFYYIQKKSQLKWISERCNDKDNFNNRIVVVMGDDIGNLAEGYQLLDTVICNDPNRPFQGILDFNGHRVSNLVIECKENSNGIVGYLGADGIVRDAIVNNLRFKCSNKISLDKIRNDCSDVVVGGLVGTNWGTVQNVITSGDMQFNGFCPEVYLASNKYEYTPSDNSVNNTNYNVFFPSKFCMNSLYNVIPYVGYFCEGADSYFNDIADPLVRREIESTSLVDWNRSIAKLSDNNINALLGRRAFQNGNGDAKQSPINYNLDHFTEHKLGNSDLIDLRTARLTDHIGTENGILKTMNDDSLHLDKDNVGFADAFEFVDGSKRNFPPMISMEDDQSFADLVLTNTINSLGEVNSWNDLQSKEIKNAVEKIDCDSECDNEWDYGASIARQIRDEIMLSLKSEYSQQVSIHQKMNPYSRIAYYCSPVVGSNFGKIVSVDCRHQLRESSDTFVGFIGNVCGKQNCGDIKRVNSMIDIVPLTEEERKKSDLASRVYSESRSFVPDYPDSYANLVNVFAYNWDYYQSPYGLSDSDQMIYSGTSASAARASDRFYQFHDFVDSGVQLKITDDGYAPKDDGYVFNQVSGRRYIDDVQKYCNFKLPGFDTQDPSTIGSEIPENIRNAKLRFAIDDEAVDPDGDTLKSFEIKAEIPVDVASERSTFKLYNPYDAENLDNIYQSIPFEREALASEIRNLLSTNVQHLTVNYIGDACKILSESDPMKFTSKQTTQGPYDVTTSDVLNYCTAFNGQCGMTKNNAIEFARNIMNAKVAVGCELLANPELDPSYQFPGGNKPFGGNDNDGLFGITNSDNVHPEYQIPAHTGPNDTDEPWDLGNNLPDFCWFMQPGEYTSGSQDGPEGYDPGVYACVSDGIPYGGTEPTAKIVHYNSDANRPNFFCSISPCGKWDLYGTDRDNPFGTESNEVFKNGKNYYETGNPRTMVTIEPRGGHTYLDEFGEFVASVASQNSGFQKYVEGDFEVKVHKISIPIMNRTQNGAYLSSSLEGVSNVSGVFLDYRRQHELWDFKRDDNGVIIEPREIVPKKVESAEVGNLDYMYIDMSIIVEEDVNHSSGPRPEGRDEDTYRVYPMIAKIPIERLRIPISAVQVVESPKAQFTNFYSEDLANYVGPVHYSARNVRYYHLTPAYDMNDLAGEQIKYILKSIYNVGGICGMLNHCASTAQRGNASLALSNRIAMDEYALNTAYCGSITDCNVKFSKSSVDFINKSLLKRWENYEISDFNDRSIAIANKFGGVAAVYEYRQNDVGTSPWTNIKDCGPDTLECLYSQKFYIGGIYVGGYEDFYTGSAPSETDFSRRSLFKIFSKVFSPLIEWANIGNILDTTNFFLNTDRLTVDNMYRSRHSSNFPIGGNIFPAYSIDVGNFCTGQSKEYRSWLLGRAHPVIEYGRNVATDDEIAEDLGRGAFQYSSLLVYGAKYKNDEYQDHYFSRLNFAKTYELMPSLLLSPSDVWLYGDYDYSPSLSLHMSPAADSPCSEYNDVYMQMFGGNPNFVNRKLGKPIMIAPLYNVLKTMNMDRAEALSRFDLLPENRFLIDAFNARYQKNNGITDRYFTWDYDMKNVRDLDRDKMPLDFTIRYGKDKNGVRGLWIHQNDKYIEENPWIQYAMKGKQYCMNDGSNIHLGYLPSDWSIIELLNRENENDEDPNMQFEEGRAIEGDDFRGILLSDENRDLVAFIDGGYGRDLISGCYIAQLPKKNKFDGDDKNYGLLTEIKVEN